MPFEVEYRQDNRVAIFHYRNPLTAHELGEGLENFRVKCGQVSQPIHCIIDITGLSVVPRNILSTLTNGRLSPLRQPMAGAFVLVINTGFVNALMTTLMRLMPRSRLSIVDSMPQALTKIEQILASEAQPAVPVP